MEEKQKILIESGIRATGDGIDPAWEYLMQEKLASLTSKKIVAGKKGKKVQPDAGGGAAEVGDEYGNAAAEKREEDDEGEEWTQGVEMELMEYAAILEATAAKSVVVPDGKGRGRCYRGESSTARWTCAGCTRPLRRTLWAWADVLK